MYDDLSFAAAVKPHLMEIAYSAKSFPADAKIEPKMGRRRPRPANLVQVGACPTELPFAPRPPPSAAKPPARSRPISTPATPGARCAAGEAETGDTAEVTAQSELARLSAAYQELQQKYDKQSCELAELQQRLAGNTLCCAKPSGVEQSCQTEERAFTAQLDEILSEAAQKSKEARKLQETVRNLRMELQQEKLNSEQFQSQTEALEEQLRLTVQNQHKVQAERTLADYHSRQAARQQSSRCSTPQSARSRKAWVEASVRDAAESAPSGVYHAGGETQEDEEDEDDEDDDDSIDSSAEFLVPSSIAQSLGVFHPQPSFH